MKKTTLELIGFLMFIKGKTREQIEQLSGFQLLMEQDDFERFKKEPFNNYSEV